MKAEHFATSFMIMIIKDKGTKSNFDAIIVRGWAKATPYTGNFCSLYIIFANSLFHFTVYSQIQRFE